MRLHPEAHGPTKSHATYRVDARGRRYAGCTDGGRRNQGLPMKYVTQGAIAAAIVLGGVPAGCMVGDPSPLDLGPSSVEAPVIPSDVFATLNPPAAAHAELCAN